MESLLPLVTQLVAGMAGGNAAGALLRQYAASMIVRTITGAIGGTGAGLILNLVGGQTGMEGLVTNALAGLAGGGVLSAIIGAVLSKK